METRLRDIRKNRGMTQQQLAAAVNATKRKIGAWERGENDLPMDYAVSIAAVLECSLEELVGRKPPQQRAIQMDSDEATLLALYRAMNAQGRERLMEQAAFLAERHPLNKAHFMGA